MFQVIREFRATATPQQFRSEVLGAIAFVFGFPILFAALWIITSA